MAWLLGHSRIKFTHHVEPVSVSDGGQQRSFLSICEKATPPCQLNPLLPTGHLQTMWTTTKAEDILIYYKRHVFTAELPEFAGSFAVDFSVPPYEAGQDPALPARTSYYTESEFDSLGNDDEKPMLICLHGLTGGSYEVYLRAALKPLVDAGWEAVVVNSRGCAGSTLTSSVLYNARATWDARQFVKWVREKWPRRKLFGMGFSLGANILTNYVAEEGDRCLFTAAVVVSNPWNLDVTNMALCSSWVGREVYSRAMGTNLRNLFQTNIEQLSKNPRVDVQKALNVKYLHDFDREVQAPTWGYPTEGAYYRDASSADSIYSIRIPFLAINAEDDPIALTDGIPWGEFRQNPYTILLSTALGGHLGWFESGGTRWFAKPIAKFFTKMAESGVEVIQPTAGEANDPSQKVSIAERPPPYLATRRKMQMVMDA